MKIRLLLFVSLLIHLWVVVAILFQTPDPPGGLSSDPSPVRKIFLNGTHSSGPGADFYSLYEAGQKVAEGEDPYNFLEPTGETPYFYPFRYLPGVAWITGWIFSRIPPLLSWRIWALILEGALALYLWFLYRRYGETPRSVLSMGVILIASPIFLELHMGQFTMVSTLLALGGITLMGRDRIATGVASLAVSAGLKLFPIVTLIALWRRTDRRSLLIAGTAVLVVLGLGLLPGYFSQHPLMQRFIDFNFKYQSGLAGGNASLFYLVYMTLQDLGFELSGKLLRSGRSLFQVLVLAPAIYIAMGRDKNRAISVEAAGSILLMGFFSGFSYVWEHSLSGVLVAGVLGNLEVSKSESIQRGQGLLPEGGYGIRTLPILTWSGLILLALPGPFLLFSSGFDLGLIDPTVEWSFWKRYLYQLSFALPQLLLYLSLLARLLRLRNLPWENDQAG